MLTTQLIHPPLLAALAACGHGSKILIADGNFPSSSVTNGRAEIVHLNVRPGMLSGDEVLDVLLTSVVFESATLMATPTDDVVPAHQGYRDALGEEVAIESVDRFAFYDAVRSDDVALVIATGDQRTYANLLLTVGVVASQVL